MATNDKVPGLLGLQSGDQTKSPDGKAIPKSPLGLSGFQWNLPPHEWSMPVEPSNVDPLVVSSDKYMVGSSHKWRRGRIYWYARTDNAYLGSDTYNAGDNTDPRYGFQFLWNPSEITTSVSMNTSITPSFADKFVDVAGAFPSGEYMTFTVRVDRTNDFAALKSIPTTAPAASIETFTTTYDQLAKQYATSNYYNAGNSLDAGFAATFVKKIQDLQKLGTIADIEYLYKAINGPGWVNQATGRYSSDIGFLSPTLLRVDIGPLSYLGYVNALSINHIEFSKGMIPIISDVNIQFNLMATAGLATTK